jgi:hypothetical protein
VLSERRASALGAPLDYAANIAEQMSQSAARARLARRTSSVNVRAHAGAHSAAMAAADGGAAKGRARRPPRPQLTQASGWQEADVLTAHMESCLLKVPTVRAHRAEDAATVGADRSGGG